MKMRRACIFVDGENLRHSIVELFKGEFDRGDYLPKRANWDGFFDWLVEKSPWDDCERVRTYWYVVDKVDCAPWGLKPNLSLNAKFAIQREREEARPWKQQPVAGKRQAVVRDDRLDSHGRSAAQQDREAGGRLAVPQSGGVTRGPPSTHRQVHGRIP